MTTLEVSAAELQEKARETYRRSVAAGRPLNRVQLGVMFDRKPSWGAQRITEVRREDVPAEGDDPDDVDGAPADTPPLVVADPLPVAPVEAVPTVVEQPPVTDVDSTDVSPAPTESAPAGTPAGTGRHVIRQWPLLLLAAGAFVAIWGGWVGLGEKAGFGPIRLLPGIADGFVINSAITLPIGVEAYAAFALRVWLSDATPSVRARSFARWSAIGSLVLGALGQVAYHLMEAAGMDTAPWWITTFVSVLPVVVLGCGAALAHLMTSGDHRE